MPTSNGNGADREVQIANVVLELVQAVQSHTEVSRRQVEMFDRTRQALVDHRDLVNRVLQSLDEKKADQDARERAWTDALRTVGERLALLDRGVQEVDRGVDRVKEITGVHELIRPEKEDGAFLTFGGWRIPLAGIFWKAARFIGPAIGGTGFGALVHHLLSKH